MSDDGFNIRIARQPDFDQVWHILRQAAEWMMENGRDQWDDKYPTAESLVNDIAQGNGWVAVDDGRAVAYCAISMDGEPAYDELVGNWLSDGAYAVIHRMAVALSHRGRGYARQFFEHAEQMCRKRGIPAVRVDTNHDNVEMLALIGQMGYHYCGKVWYFHGGRRVERVAYEKVL